jgi:ketosteroid isomerase-like protein
MLFLKGQAMNLAGAATAALVISFLGGCATLAHTDREKEALLQRDREWSSAASEGRNLEQIVAYWSDDATVYPAGAPIVRGKTSIREYVRQSLAVPGFQIRWRPEQASVSNDATLGYTTGENTVTVPGPDGKLIHISGRYTTVWRRESGGDWRCVVDIWNSGP